MNHCITKIREIVGREQGARRDVFQLGYNLGRLSEMTGLGREAFWDRWKKPVLAWDQVTLRQLASDLPPKFGDNNLNSADDIPVLPDDPPARGAP